MVRISKLTDYAVIIMVFMAKMPRESLFQAGDIAEKTGIAPPTVSKLLKLLVKHQWLVSFRGVNGGYQLNIIPEQITVADLIQGLEGPIAITECNLEHTQCPTESLCGTRNPWQHINKLITNTLKTITLSDLVKTSHFQEYSFSEYSNSKTKEAQNPKSKLKEIIFHVHTT